MGNQYSITRHRTAKIFKLALLTLKILTVKNDAPALPPQHKEAGQDCTPLRTVLRTASEKGRPDSPLYFGAGGVTRNSR